MRLDMVFLRCLVQACGRCSAAGLGGEEAGDEPRRTRFSSITRMISSRAAPQARCEDGSGVGRRGRVQDLGVDEGRQRGHPAAENVDVDRVAKPAVTRIGAVSPITRAIAKVTPEAMPEIAVGMTTLRHGRHLRTPSA